MNNNTMNMTMVAEAVGTRLATRFRDRQQSAQAISPQYERLWAAIAHIAPYGKRLRPYLTYLGYRISGGQDDELVLDAGTALELLHICVLALDDFIDRDYVRHGQPNIAGLYRVQYQELVVDMQERDHFANSSAMQASHLLLSEMYQALQQLPVNTAMRQRIMMLVDAAIFTVSGGELLDTEAPLYAVSAADSLAIAEYKTAYYSCSVPLMVGAALAGADLQIQEQYGDIGKHLGIAYQLRDDLLGTFGDETQTGKSSIGDLREAKRTYLLQATYQRATAEETKQMDDIFAHHRHDVAQLQVVKDVMVSSGARQATETLAAGHIAQARQGVRELSVKYPLASLLDDCILQLVGRNA